MKEKMFEAAKQVIKNAYAPYSKFSVGVCFRTDDNKLFAGCNVENASYSLVLCAESSALGMMVSAGYTKIKEVVITSSGDMLCPPCGACRQRLYEMADGNIPVHLYKLTGEHKTFHINDLLPHAFGSINLE